MQKIGWVEVSLKKYGAIVYNQQARDILSQKFNVELIVASARYFQKLRYLKVPESLFHLTKLTGEKDIWVRDFYSTLTLPFDKTKGKQIVIMHHLDFTAFPLLARPPFFFLTKLFYRNLKKVDAIVTVSEYWRQHFLERGYSNVHTIYNSFDFSQYQIPDSEIVEFRKKYELEGKPILYLGNCQRAKGVVEAYNALKGLDAHLVTSGRLQVKMPARNLEIEYKDYLRLLKASSIVIAMSKFKEGWCRTAHEAMLLKTPVIGSGIGGMKELLDGGDQIISESFKDLLGKVEYLLAQPNTRKELGEKGYRFAKQFSMERFNKEWIHFIEQQL